MKNHILIFFILLFSVSLYSQSGTVRGTVYDDNTGETILFGNVVVVETQNGTTTDLDGTYSLELPVGIYSIEFSYIGYANLVISDVVVTDNNVTTLDARIVEASEMMEEIVVTARQARNTEAALATIKRRSTNLLDGISSASFKKIGDSNAATAVKRVTGVSIEGGKYVYVRGLGDRYTKSILNGMDIPGLDPDRNTIQMDIFPTNIIDNIIVLKSFTADLPADFTGGVVDINTKNFPDEKTSSISVGVSYNPSMHFTSNYLTYDGSSTDILGFDNGVRDIPTDKRLNIPNRVIVLNDNSYQSEFSSILGGFNPDLAAYQTTSFMDYNFGYTLGNQINTYHGTWGYNLALTYKNTTDFYENAVNSRYGKGNDSRDTELDLREHQVGNYGQNNVLLAGLAGLSFKTKASRYSLNILRLQNGESTAGLFKYTGADQGSNFTADQHNLEYSQRAITNVLLKGTHTFQEGGFKVDWKLAPTLSNITDPDIRFTRIRTDGDKYTIGTESGIPQRIWRYLDETNLSGKIDLTKEYSFNDKTAKVKIGSGYTRKNRTYEIQNFGIFTGNTEVTQDPNILLSEENFFTTENLGGLYYEPQFIPINANYYDAEINTMSAYVSNEMDLFSNLKTVAGLRMESYTQYYSGANQNRESFKDAKVLDDLGFFPTLNLIYSVTEKSNLRASFSQTIARPSFKEASFSTIIDPLSGRTFIGGFFPDIDVATGEEIWDGNLQSTDIQNYDIRYEYYQDRGQNISLSGFYKSFKNPIEIVQYVQATNNFQPRNVGDGMVVGAELEFLKFLGEPNTKLGNLAINGNVTVTSSSIQMSETEFSSRVNNKREGEDVKDTRAMAGQAPFIVNAGFSYKGTNGFQAGVYYNVKGKTLQYVGVADRPDVYSKPFHSLNLTANYSFGKFNRYKAGLKIENLLSSERESVFESFGAQDQLFSSLDPQRSIGLSLSYRLN